MIILVASSFSTHKAQPGIRWTPKTWRTRDGKTEVYYATTELFPPDGFVLDKRYTWKVGGEPAEAWFSPEVLAAWHGESRGVGELSRKPHIIYSQNRELDIYEKLAAAAPAQSVIPQTVRRAPARQGDALIQACRTEIDLAIADYSRKLAVKKAEQNKELMQLQAETMRVIRQISASYGQPNFVTRLPG